MKFNSSVIFSIPAKEFFAILGKEPFSAALEVAYNERTSIHHFDKTKPYGLGAEIEDFSWDYAEFEPSTASYVYMRSFHEIKVTIPVTYNNGAEAENAESEAAD